jgi:hypothetical protein
MTEAVVLINSFEVAAADAEEFIAASEKTRGYPQTRPGYIDAALHQALAPDATFQFVNAAHWRGAAEFVGHRQPEYAGGLAGYPPHPALYRVVRTRRLAGCPLLTLAYGPCQEATRLPDRCSRNRLP